MHDSPPKKHSLYLQDHVAPSESNNMSNYSAQHQISWATHLLNQHQQIKANHAAPGGRAGTTKSPGVSMRTAQNTLGMCLFKPSYAYCNPTQLATTGTSQNAPRSQNIDVNEEV